MKCLKSMFETSKCNSIKNDLFLIPQSSENGCYLQYIFTSLPVKYDTGTYMWICQEYPAVEAFWKQERIEYIFFFFSFKKTAEHQYKLNLQLGLCTDSNRGALFLIIYLLWVPEFFFNKPCKKYGILSLDLCCHDNPVSLDEKYLRISLMLSGTYLLLLELYNNASKTIGRLQVPHKHSISLLSIKMAWIFKDAV